MDRSAIDTMLGQVLDQALDQVLDEVAIAAGMVVLVVRQFLWRSAEPHRMLRLPLIVLALGLALTASQLGAVTRWTPADAIVLGELGLVAVTGAVMGRVTRFRRAASGLQYRLTGVGVWLWALFVAVRAGCYLLVQRWGADLAALGGVVLLSFGVNRLVATLVVRRRLHASGGPLVPGDPDHLKTGLEVGRAVS